MIVQCEHCRTKFRLADDRVSGRGVKVRCSKCAHVFTVQVDVSAAPPTRSDLSVDPSAFGPPSQPPSFDRPMQSGDLMAAIDDLMLPGSATLGGTAPTGHAGLDLPPSAFGASAFGAPTAFGGPPQGSPPGMGAGLTASGTMRVPNVPRPMLPEPAWLTPAAPPPPAPLQPPMFSPAGMPRLPFDLGPTAPVIKRPSLSVMPAGRPPPGQTMPSVPRALLDQAAFQPDPATSDRLRALAELDGFGSHKFDDDNPFGTPDPAAAAAAALKAAEELANLPIDREPPLQFDLRSHPPTMDLPPAPPRIEARPPTMDLMPRPPAMDRRPPTMDLPPLRPPSPSMELEGSVSPPLRPSIELPPSRHSWGLSFVNEPSAPNLTGLPPKVPSSQSIKVPTFPPPPVFDPFLDAPKSVLPPPLAQPPQQMEREERTDQFMIGPHTDDPFAGLGDAFHGGAQGAGAMIDVDLGELQDTEKERKDPAKIGRLDLRKGLLGAAGVVSFGDAEPSTKIASKNKTSSEDVRARTRRSLVRTAGLVLVLSGLAAFAFITEKSNHETRVGGIAVFDQPSLVAGSIAAIEAKQARVTSYPLRDPHPHLVVSGLAVNRGDTLSGDVEVVALMLDGDKVVQQRHSPLGVLALDALAKAKTSAEVDQAWQNAEHRAGPWNSGESRKFMVVFPDVPEQIHDYSFRVEFRTATATAAATAAH